MPPRSQVPKGASGPRSVSTCLGLGWSRLRQGRTLVGLLWLETALVAGLTLAGLALPLGTVGFERVRTVLSADRHQVQEWLIWLAEDATWRDFAPRSPALLAALAGLFVLWTVALFVYCWFQAGLYGVLVETLPRSADRSSWSSTIDLGSFARHARRHLWRVFGLLHAFVLYATGVLFLGLWVVWLAVWAFLAWGGLAAAALLLGGMLPVGWLGGVVGLWFLTSRADVARPESGVRSAQRRGWRVLRRRAGAVIVLGLLFVALGLVAGGLFAPVGLLARKLLGAGSTAWWLVRGAVELATWGLYAALAVFVGASTVALTQDPSDGETGDEERAGRRS